MLRSFFAKEDGQGLVEYALILVLIAIVVIGILTLLGSKVSEVFSTINSGLNPLFSSDPTQQRRCPSLFRAGASLLVLIPSSLDRL
jgi:pilus assembly protein Flp/PilA